MAGPKVAVFGVPTAAGAHAGGGERAVGLVFIDPTAAPNTREPTPAGSVGGRAVPLALGRGDPVAPAALGPGPAVEPPHGALLGFRELDPGERAPLGELGLAL